jgi:hypothetical protein
MASTKKIRLTYHVVPRFDIAAQGGPLSLGTIVADLGLLRPLNRGYHVKIPDNLIYPPVPQTNFKDTLAKVRELNFAAWVRALGLPVGGSVNVGDSKGVEETVFCKSIVTTYFDPDPAGDYVKKCFGVKPIQDILDGAKHHTADLYMVTGLKVAESLKFNMSSDEKAQAEAEVSGKEPHTNAVEAGVKAKVECEKKQGREFEVDGIVIGFRVNKYHCVRKRFGKDWNYKDEGVLDGEMQEDQELESEQPEVHPEQVPIPEEAVAQAQAGVTGDDECWVGPIA